MVIWGMVYHCFNHISGVCPCQSLNGSTLLGGNRGHDPPISPEIDDFVADHLQKWSVGMNFW